MKERISAILHDRGTSHPQGSTTEESDELFWSLVTRALGWARWAAPVTLVVLQTVG